jgi:diguanylate cyclase (GGDEF)-like protein
MDNQILPSITPGQPMPLPPLGLLASHAAASADSSSLVTRGVGRCLGRYFPHLLKNNFNRVLLVDDDPENHLSVGQILRTSGYRVQHALSESDAAGILKENTPDFLVLDWKPSPPGNLPYYDSLRRSFLDRYLYIILMASEDLVRNKVQMVAAGANAFLVKPVQPGELLSLLQAGTRIVEEHLRLKELAMHDPLTGLMNRRIFAELQKLEWSRALRHGEAISCAMLDVDYFKSVNDVLGHVPGDRILCRISEIMKCVGRKSDILCRYGGDEFCMFMPNTDLQGALKCAERLRSAVIEEGRRCADTATFPTVTIGVATRTDDMESAETLVGKADEALIWAKQNNRNSVAAYDASQDALVAFCSAQQDVQ